MALASRNAQALGRLLAFASVLALAGCPEEPPVTTADTGGAGRDAGKARDAYVYVPEDAGPPGEDAAALPPGPDAGAAGPDAASAGPDAATAGPDASAPGADAGPANTFWLTLLHHSDSESAMTTTDNYGGVAYFTAKVKALKAEAATWQPTAGAGEVVKTGTILVSAGDSFLAGLNFRASLDKGVPFYETLAMQELGYQAIAVGNHDFDYGPDTLADFVKGFNPAVPFLSANMNWSGEAALVAQATAGRLARSAVVTVDGEPYGLVGATTPELPLLSMVKSVTVSAIAAAVNAEVASLTAAGVKKIILLSHNQALANDKALVPSLHDVDIVVSGGGHEVPDISSGLYVPSERKTGTYPEWIADADAVQVPIVAAGSLYRYVGRLTAKFDLAGKLVSIDGARSGPLRVSHASADSDAVAADSNVQASVVTPIETATNVLKTVIVGATQVPLNGLRNDVRTKETNEGDLVADALLWQGQQLAAAAGVASPQVALQNGGGIRNNSVVPVGNLSEFDTFTLLPFSNRVAVVPNVSRDTFKALLENAVSKVEAIDGRFCQVAGFKFTWDGSQAARVVDAAGNVTTPGSRVRTVTLDDGTPLVTGGAVVAGGTLAVATIDFLANGGDGNSYGGAPFTILEATYQQAFKNYVAGPLSGTITATKYPTAGTGRIIAANACGNGLVEGTEACDDSNVNANDGCSATCGLETGYTCTGAPSVCVKSCGNSTIDASEECDDGNSVAADGCSAACKSERSLASLGPAALSILQTGGTGIVRLTLSDVAPTGGIKVALSSSAPGNVAVPASVLVPAGSSTAGFRVRADVTGAATASVTATLTGGNQTAVVTVTTTATVAASGNLVINEVLPDPPTTAGDASCDGVVNTTDDEFVEIANPGTTPVALQDVSLWDALNGGTKRHTFGALTLGPGEAVVVFAGTGIATTAAGPWCTGLQSGTHLGDAATYSATAGQLSLNNTTETLTLTANSTSVSGVVIDSLTWTSGTNKSRVRNPDYTGTFGYHTAATGFATDRMWTPGTLLTGRPFADASPP